MTLGHAFVEQLMNVERIRYQIDALTVYVFVVYLHLAHLEHDMPPA